MIFKHARIRLSFGSHRLAYGIAYILISRETLLTFIIFWAQFFFGFYANTQRRHRLDQVRLLAELLHIFNIFARTHILECVQVDGKKKIRIFKNRNLGNSGCALQWPK